MKPTSVTVSSQATSDWIPVDYRKCPFQVGQAVVLSAGASLTYSVEHTFDDIQDSSITPTAFADATIAAKTANLSGSLDVPVRAIRLNVTAYTGGTATLTIIQAGE